MVERPSLDRIRAAADALRGVTMHTPLVPYRATDGGAPIGVKAEVLQPIGSFKLRGVFCAVSALGAARRRPGISTVSAGNTAQALAWCGRHFGVEARAIMPDSAPRAKVDAVVALGGTPVLVPRDEVFAYLRERRWEREPFGWVCPWTDPGLHAGHGTLGLELVADAPDVDTVFVPVGGGGLLCGVGSALRALRPSVRIVAVEPEGCAALHASLAAGRPVTVPCATMCDGVAVPFVTDEMFPVLRELADDVVRVGEDAVRAAIRACARDLKLVAEGAGALAIAAALATPPHERGRSVALLTGGSIDAATFARIVAPISA